MNLYHTVIHRALERHLDPRERAWTRIPGWADVAPEAWYNWRWQWRHRIRTVPQLLQRMPRLADRAEELARVVRRYPLEISPYYLSLIDTPTSTDPVYRQAIPEIAELDIGTTSFLSTDPQREAHWSPVPGLVHRYSDRVLLVLSNQCTTFCRHCFRKRILGQPGVATAIRNFDAILAYLMRHREIREVILSGGDPLTLSSRVLAKVLGCLRTIPHVETIRIGTRVPVTLPMRIWDPRLLAILDRYGPVWIVTHFNHVREVTREAAAAVECLHRVRAPVVNQAVLLRGVNDSPPAMEALHRALIAMGVKPYYLHHPDPVQGTAHFRVAIDRGLEIMDHLRAQVSGLANPTFVVDLPDGGGKIPLLPDYVVRREERGWWLRNPMREQFWYDETWLADEHNEDHDRADARAP